MRESSGRRSESLYTGVDGLRLAVGSSALLLDERERRSDSSPLFEAVLLSWLERSADSMLGNDVFGWAWLLDVDTLGLRLLLGELGDGILLAVDGLDLDWLEEELDDCDCDCDCDELDALDCDFCCGCAGGCCCVCWFLQPLITAASTTIDARDCKRKPMGFCSGVSALCVKRCAIFRNTMSYLLMRSRAAAKSRRPVCSLSVRQFSSAGVCPAKTFICQYLTRFRLPVNGRAIHLQSQTNLATSVEHYSSFSLSLSSVKNKSLHDAGRVNRFAVFKPRAELGPLKDVAHPRPDAHFVFRPGA